MYAFIYSHTDLQPDYIYYAVLESYFRKTSACCLKLIFSPSVNQLKIGFAY